MKISLATNFDDNLIDEIKNYNVYELYGRMPYDLLSGGRPNNSINKLTKSQFENHVKKTRANGINFNYLFNGACTENQEQDENWKHRFKEYVLYLKDVGVNAFTITNPHILKLIKKIYPDAICRVSTFACVNTLTKMKYWEKLGADIICADFTTINRNFNLLKEIVNELKTAKVELLATNSCLKDCPLIHTHVNSISHASNMKCSEEYIDWCLHKCQYYELCNVFEYIKSPWIRPEDVKYYENIGIEHIKITERDFPTDMLVKRLKAYTDRSYEGNLLDLIQGHGVSHKIVNTSLVDKINLNDKNTVLNEIAKIRGFKQERTYPSHIYIDNKKLGNFLNFFVKGKCIGNCDKCGYCKQISDYSITVNQEISSYLIELYRLLENFMMEI